jgi:hypothetical protein
MIMIYKKGGAGCVFKEIPKTKGALEPEVRVEAEYKPHV